MDTTRKFWHPGHGAVHHAVFAATEAGREAAGAGLIREARISPVPTAVWTNMRVRTGAAVARSAYEAADEAGMVEDLAMIRDIRARALDRGEAALWTPTRNRPVIVAVTDITGAHMRGREVEAMLASLVRSGGRAGIGLALVGDDTVMEAAAMPLPLRILRVDSRRYPRPARAGG